MRHAQHSLFPRRARRAGAVDPRVRAAARLDELGRAADRGAGVRARRAFIAQRRPPLQPDRDPRLYRAVVPGRRLHLTKKEARPKPGFCFQPSAELAAPARSPAPPPMQYTYLGGDRKSAGSGKSVSVRVDLRGTRIIQKQKIQIIE